MLTRVLAEYIASALARPLPETARQQTVLHTLDTVAAMISGTTLAAGRKVLPFVQTLGGTAESTVIGTRFVTTAINAALAHGMLAHADETDDSHALSLTHPGCAIVSAALAVAEREGRSGRDLLRAVAAGYDVGTRVAAALGGGQFLDHYHHSSHAFGGTFGAMAAAAALSGLDAERAGHAIAYAVQLASGIPCWLADSDRIEKAFMFGGMPAQSGVQAATMAAAGFSGARASLEATPGLFAAFPDRAKPERAIEDLGLRFEVMRTSIKKWSVGSPIQSALNALELLMTGQGITEAEVARIVVTLPPRRAEAVDNRPMPDVNLQYQLALLLTDGTISFASCHDQRRMDDPQIKALRERIRVVARADAAEGGQAHVAVTLADGRTVEHQVVHVRGTPGNPMTAEEVVAKAQGLIEPVVCAATANELIARLLGLEQLVDVRALRPLLQF